MAKKLPEFTRDQVIRLWLSRQGLLNVGKTPKLDRRAFVKHLERAGALQVDTVNVVDRAHYLTLWSRFGSFGRDKIDKWIYRDKVAYEYWGHEASILPISHLPLGLRRMRQYPPKQWVNAAYWKHYNTSPGSKRRVLKHLQDRGPLESRDFERSQLDLEQQKILGWGSLLPKEDKRSLQLLWHAGKVAIANRRQFRKIYDLSDRVYPEFDPATPTAFHNSWLLIGLSGCGIASERHLVNYVTGPNLAAPERARVLTRNLKQGKIVEVQVRGQSGRWFALPEHLGQVTSLSEPVGTTLICPFDSLLWQRKRAEQLLNFRYRVEIYVPQPKREFGYYVLPILHHGQLVGRLDPKFHRDRSCLEIKSLHFEPGFRPNRQFRLALNKRLSSLADFLGAKSIEMPKK